MLFLLSMLSLASPTECTDLSGDLERAQEHFNLANIQEAKTVVEYALLDRECQTAVVSRDDLLKMYHLDALLGVVSQDNDEALAGVIRAVTVDPTAPPPRMYGPDLLAMHKAWAKRLGERTLLLTPEDPSTELWIDGALVMGETEVVMGEHLVQVVDSDSIETDLLDITLEMDASKAPFQLRAKPAPIQEVERTVYAPRPPRQINKTVVAVGAGTMAIGGVLILTGRLMEARFDVNPYNELNYGGCRYPSDCWASERATKIGRDAAQVNAAYLIGYGAVAVGLSTIGLEVFVLQNANARGLGVRGRL